MAPRRVITYDVRRCGAWVDAVAHPADWTLDRVRVEVRRTHGEAASAWPAPYHPMPPREGS